MVPECPYVRLRFCEVVFVGQNTGSTLLSLEYGCLGDGGGQLFSFSYYFLKEIMSPQKAGNMLFFFFPSLFFLLSIHSLVF
jgi:hypothetical protein